MNSVTYTMAFVMGFTLSLHCAGMCGPIMMVLPFQIFKGFRKFAAIGLYHLGRISVYASLAILLHSFRDIFNPRVQQYVSVGLGSLLLVIGIVSFIPGKVRVKLPWTEFIKSQLGRFMANPSVATLGMAGILNGLLPCGLVYVALSASLSAGNTSQAALFMYVFGLGTLPILLSITLLSKTNFVRNKLSFIRAASVKRMVPVMMFLFGCIFVLRGMNLGIPYLSPKVEVTGHVIKSCCCHKTKM